MCHWLGNKLFFCLFFIFVIDLDRSETDQINLQIEDVFGVPQTIGAKIIPRFGNKFEHILPSRGNISSLDVILHSELWIQNLTQLPLVFGVPSTQLFLSGHSVPNSNDGNNFDTPSKIAAQAALMELSSILEFGDKGKGLIQEEDSDCIGGDVFNIPGQHCSLIVGELFQSNFLSIFFEDQLICQLLRQCIPCDNFRGSI